MPKVAYEPSNPKENGAYFTPDAVVRSLVSWAVRDETDLMLDPSCGDGRFLLGHVKSVGVEQDPVSAQVARQRAPGALVHEGDFFRWAASAEIRFDCAVGNPPFIRYQRFSGEARTNALNFCNRLGASFSGLTSSWAPFLVAAGNLVKPGGRMSFVVPAEIGHAPYAAPLLEWLTREFSTVQIIAVRDKLFPRLSEDCWLLYAEGRGGRTDRLSFSAIDQFTSSNAPPRVSIEVSLADWRNNWNRRLRPFLLSSQVRNIYSEIINAPSTRRLGSIASVGIGYVSGANDFFHLKPSEIAAWGIPKSSLTPAVRNARILPKDDLTLHHLKEMEQEDSPMFLLNLRKGGKVSPSVRDYLDSADGLEARKGYKCRNRSPWYVVPDVRVPDFFLAYMSGRRVSVVRNSAGATCTNSLHAVTLHDAEDAAALSAVRSTAFFQLSCELEGHPLGGGMLKLEPREAARIAIPANETLVEMDNSIVQSAVTDLQRWRHYAD